MVIDFKKLNEKKVTAILPPIGGEAAILTLQFEDGSRIQIHGNDLGSWTTSFPKVDEPFMSFFDAVDHFNDNNYGTDPEIELTESTFSIKNDRNTVTISTKATDVDWNWLKRIYEEDRENLIGGIACGPFFRVSFNKGNFEYPRNDRGQFIESFPQEKV